MTPPRVAVHVDVIRALMRSQTFPDASALARVAGIGATTMRRVLRGDSLIITADTADRIADALGVDPCTIARPITSVWVLGPDGPEPLARSIARSAVTP